MLNTATLALILLRGFDLQLLQWRIQRHCARSKTLLYIYSKMSWGHWWNTLFFEASDVMSANLCPLWIQRNTLASCTSWTSCTEAGGRTQEPIVALNMYGNVYLGMNVWWMRKNCGTKQFTSQLNCWKYMHINMCKLLHGTMGNLCQTGWLNATYATWNEPKLDTLLHLHFWRVWHFALLAAAWPNVPKPLSTVRGVHW